MKRLFPVLGFFSWLIVGHCLAGSATWNLSPASGDWNTASNWTPETVPSLPSDVATFGASNVTNVLISGSVIHVGSIIYTLEAGAYTTDISESTEIGRGGVVNNSPATQTFEVGACLSFSGSANAGTNVVYVGEAQAESCGLLGEITLGDSSNGGNATFIMDGNTADRPQYGSLTFVGASTAGNSTIILQAGATRAGGVQFLGSASAGKSKIIIEAGSQVIFSGTSTAAHSSIFVGPSGHLAFHHDATGGECRVVMSGGKLSFVTLGGGLEIGSLEGDGGSVQMKAGLTVGGNGLSTTYGGLLQGPSTLTKTGNGSLTLTGANTYRGGTTVNGGTLLVNNPSGTATGSAGVGVSAGTLGGESNITGAVVIGGANGPGAYLAPGINGPGILTINNILVFESTSIYQCDLNLDVVQTDEVTATSVSITGRAQFSLQPSGTQILSSGTVFTVINNTAGTPISGTFSNLPDGGTITAGPNTLQANYEGGDGNDLTLTVVQ